jgi:hypothetical protein
MKKIVSLLFAILTLSAAQAQKKPKDWSKVMTRPGDHFMLQLTSDHWMGTPDSINRHINGLSRGGNVYFMLDKPFKSNPRLSVAFGVGMGTSNIYFKTMGVDVRSNSTTYLPFINQDSLVHFKKYKLTTAFLEVPVELRFSSNPETDSKSFKVALGVKIGTLLNVHTKGKDPVDKNGASVNAYTEKESSKRYFNSTRLAATARIGYGHYSLFGSYQINGILKDGTGATMKLLQVGLCLSGL